MRRVLLALSVCLAAAGCTVVSSNSDTDNDAGVGGASGAGGTAGAGATAGAAGQPGSACGEVPVEGRCLDNQTIEKCMSSPADDKPPSVVKATCKGGMVCRTSAEGASCEVEGECVPGTSECDGEHNVRTCQSGKWVVSTCDTGLCKSKPGYGATCTQNAGGQSYPITGVLTYEHAPMKSDRTGFDTDNPVVDAAYTVIVVAYDNDEFIGSAYTTGSDTPSDDGRFTIEATKAPTANTWLFFFPMFYNDDGIPQVAVAHPSTYTYSNLESKEYWWWSVDTKGAADVGTVLIKLADGSAALYLYELLAYGMSQAMELVPQVKPFNVLGLWDSGGKFDCGNGTCFVPKGWGATVKYDGGEDLYQGAVLIAGTEETPQQWAPSVILHEFGHYMMDAYSKSPAEAGKHNTVSLEPPGQAWSEGWASFYGQMTLGRPIYFDKQEGTAWWFDISQPKDSVPMPDPNGAIDQQMAELADGAILWHLFDPGSTGASEESWDLAAVEPALIWKAFTSKRMTQQNRGYTKVDLLDYLDSLRCEGVTEQQLSSITGHFGFPYDNAQQCAQ